MSRLSVLVALALALPPAASARTLRVGPLEEYVTVASAVHVAEEGDTVLVTPKTYFERLTVRDKNIVLRGEMGATATVIDGSVSVGNVITLSRVSRSMIVEDLTIRGGVFNTAARESLGAAIYINRGSPTIQRCNLVENVARAGGGVAAYFFSHPLIQDCWIAYNSGGGIFIELDDGMQSATDRAEIRNCFMVKNRGYGVSVIKGARATVENCTIAYNSGDGVRSAIRGGETDPIPEGKSHVALRRTIVSHNAGPGVIRHDPGVCFDLECNDVYGNGVTGNDNWVNTDLTDPCFNGRGVGDLSIDPDYADAAADNFVLAPTASLRGIRCGSDCGLPGAGNDCTVSVQQKSWGAIKSLYR